MLTIADWRKIRAAQKNGILIPVRAYQAARKAGIPFYVACAFLMQESGGGANVFGHDPTIYVGAGQVTQQNYAAYKAMRQHTGKMQGVGPMQLTWYGFQDAADALGGCWRPLCNMVVGFQHIAELHRASGDWRKAAHDYNGSGPAADAYANEMVTRFSTWNKIVGA